jgi:flagellar biosynthesis anti-sigma factor FlgM
VRISETYSYPPQSYIRSAIPAPAKELINSSSESLGTDSVGGATVTAAADRENRVAEIRQQVQNGAYEVDSAAVASKLIDSHLDS